MNRQDVLSHLRENPEISVLIIGGGINGIGVFRELALNGVDVLLVERADFCSGGSAASSHMAHGGIRYLENGEFRLVREAVRERNLMIQNAPHLVRPLYCHSHFQKMNGVAEGYRVKPEDIINWAGNHLNLEAVGNISDPNIEPGTFLVVPGDTREYINWSAPRISRDDPSVARFIGPGACGTIMDGAVGFGSFIWPSANHFLSGYDYSPATNHYGIDIDGDLGTPLWASDAGVVVYAGWNDHGYGIWWWLTTAATGGLSAHIWTPSPLAVDRVFSRAPPWAPSAPPVPPVARISTSKAVHPKTDA